MFLRPGQSTSIGVCLVPPGPEPPRGGLVPQLSSTRLGAPLGASEQGASLLQGDTPLLTVAAANTAQSHGPAPLKNGPSPTVLFCPTRTAGTPGARVGCLPQHLLLTSSCDRMFLKNHFHMSAELGPPPHGCGRPWVNSRQRPCSAAPLLDDSVIVQKLAVTGSACPRCDTW